MNVDIDANGNAKLNRNNGFQPCFRFQCGFSLCTWTNFLRKWSPILHNIWSLSWRLTLIKIKVIQAAFLNQCRVLLLNLIRKEFA